jgi:predicted transcriptional regulator
MTSILDDIDITLANGDLEVFKQWVEAKLESKDRQIKHLLNRIQKLEDQCTLLESILNSKPDKNELDHRIDELYQIFKYRYEN